MSTLKEVAYPRYTYDDYVNWEDRWELINGIAYSMVSALILKHHLMRFLKNDLKEFDFSKIW